MKISIDVTGFREVTAAVESDVSIAATEAMRGATYKAVRDLRRQVTDAGMSQRLANTWRDRVYPEKRRSMTPTGYIWSNAPEIIDSFSRGATIVPIAGSRFLAIPTDRVPNARRRMGFDGKVVRGGRMTPAEVEHTFNADLFYKRGKNGNVLAFLNLVRAKNGRGVRRGTAGRARQGRAPEPILMFVLVPAVKMPKLFDLDAAAQTWANNYTAEFARRLGGR